MGVNDINSPEAVELMSRLFNRRLHFDAWGTCLVQNKVGGYSNEDINKVK